MDNCSYISQDHPVLDAISRSWAVIEFDPTGNIVAVNDNFCNAIGYSRHEIVGSHHRMFCFDELVNSKEYTDFWADLKRGISNTGSHVRRKKDGSSLWIEASYMPVFSDNGKVVAVIKIATDITRAHEAAEENNIRYTAIKTTNIVAEFDSSGNLLTGNDKLWNFLHGNSAVHDAVPDLVNKLIAAEQFSKLMIGDTVSFESHYQRGDSNRWIQGNIFPAKDSSNKVSKLLLFGQDITERKNTVEETNDLMQQVIEVSNQIGKIVSTINGISIQTQLLSLNAAIEAAHAGKAGRGFAVVAEEVRNLSKRSAQAADEIGELVITTKASIDELAASLEKLAAN